MPCCLFQRIPYFGTSFLNSIYLLYLFVWCCVSVKCCFCFQCRWLLWFHVESYFLTFTFGLYWICSSYWYHEILNWFCSCMDDRKISNHFAEWGSKLRTKNKEWRTMLSSSSLKMFSIGDHQHFTTPKLPKYGFSSFINIYPWIWTDRQQLIEMESLTWMWCNPCSII